MEELSHVVKMGKSHKAPGKEGISQDFFKYTWDIIQNDMLETVNQMYTEGKITDKQTHGLIVCVTKKPKPTRPEDYRPLTLLNSDIKLLTRIIANRISPSSTACNCKDRKWIHSLQSGYDYGIS